MASGRNLCVRERYSKGGREITSFTVYAEFVLCLTLLLYSTDAPIEQISVLGNENRYLLPPLPSLTADQNRLGGRLLKTSLVDFGGSNKNLSWDGSSLWPVSCGILTGVPYRTHIDHAPEYSEPVSSSILPRRPWERANGSCEIRRRHSLCDVKENHACPNGAILC